MAIDVIKHFQELYFVALFESKNMYLLHETCNDYYQR